jgi:hypothetical protein
MKDEWSELHTGRLILVVRASPHPIHPPPPTATKVEGWVDPAAGLDALGKIRRVTTIENPSTIFRTPTQPVIWLSSPKTGS